MYRILALLILLACIGTSAYYRRRARAEGGTIERRRETPGLIVVRIFVTLPLMLSIVLYLVNPRLMGWSSLPLPGWARLIGAVTGTCAVCSTFWVFRSIGKNVSETVLTKDGHELVTHGPYRWVRHPLYTTGILLIVSIGLLAANWFILGLGVLVAVLIRVVVIPAEEAQLIAKFGEEYEAYRARTGALAPPVGATR